MIVLVAQSCLTLYDPMDCSPPSSSVRGIFQARTLEWIAIPFSRGSSQPEIKPKSSRTADRFLTDWATRKAEYQRTYTFKSFFIIQFSSIQFSRSVMSDSLRPHELQHARPPCLSPTPGVYPNSHPLSWWCHPTVSSSVVPFSSCPQSFPASERFQMIKISLIKTGLQSHSGDTDFYTVSHSFIVHSSNTIDYKLSAEWNKQQK